MWRLGLGSMAADKEKHCFGASAMEQGLVKAVLVVPGFGFGHSNLGGTILLVDRHSYIHIHGSDIYLYPVYIVCSLIQAHLMYT